MFCSSQSRNVSGINLSAVTVVRRVKYLSRDIFNKLKSKCKEFEFYSLVMDKSTDAADTAQQAIFIPYVDRDFTIVEELARIVAHSGTL